MDGADAEEVEGRVVGGEEEEVAGCEVDESVEHGGASGGEAGGAEDVEDWGPEEREVERVGRHVGGSEGELK